MLFKECLCIIPLLVFFSVLSSQDLNKYRNDISTEQYNDLIEKVAEVLEEPDLIQRSGRLKDLAISTTRLGNYLAEELYDKALELAIESKNDSIIAEVTMSSCLPRLNTGRYTEGRAMLDNAMKYWLVSKDTLSWAKCHTVMGYLERLEGSNYLAIKNLTRAKELKAAVVPLYEMWDITNRLMINYSQLGDHETVVALGEEFIKSAEHLEPKPRGYNTILRNTGSSLINLGEIERAKKYIEISLPSWKDSGVPKLKSYAYDILYKLAIEEKDFLKARLYADSSLVNASLFGSDNMICYAHLKLYKIYTHLNDPTKRSFHIEKALHHANLSQLNTAILAVSSEASLYRAETKSYKEAYILKAIADSINNEMYSTDKTNNLRKFEKQIVEERGQKEINLLNAKNQIAQLKLTNSRRLVIMTGLGLGLLSLFTLILISLNRRIKNQKNTIASALSEKETLLREIHHRVKNNLQFISSLLGLQSDHIQDQTALGALQEGQDRVQSMALIHQNLYQEDNLTGVALDEYFTKLAQGLFDSYNIHNDQIQFKTDIENINLDVDSVIPIGLIVNELITNCLKYAFPGGKKGLITIELKVINQLLHLIISDNGIGMTSQQIANLGTSFGYKLVEAFTRQLNAELSIDHSSGTSVNIIIRDFKKAA